jgi:hypothetical protein
MIVVRPGHFDQRPSSHSKIFGRGRLRTSAGAFSMRLLASDCQEGGSPWLDIADNAGRALRIANTVAAITQVLHRSLSLGGFWPQGCRAVVCEATGGYERPLMLAAVQLGLPLRRVHPNRARAFA